VSGPTPGGLSCELPASPNTVASPGTKALTARLWKGPGATARLELLRRTRSIAIVGASNNPARASFFVATYLLASSPYDVYFVNPRADEILGHRVYPTLASLPVVPDLVDVFRRHDDLPSVLDETLAVTTYMGGGPSLMMYAASAIAAFEEFSAPEGARE